MRGAPATENYVFQSECRLRLQEVEFLAFQGAIKRFGYREDLNDDHMNAIKRLIKLNFIEMQEQPNSAFALVYKDESFFFLHKRHTVKNLLKLGFLLCSFQSHEA